MSESFSATLSPREVLIRYHHAMLHLSADELADLYAVDAIHEFPFLAPGRPTRYRGREEVRAGYWAAWSASPVRLEEIRNVMVYETTDPEVIIGEWAATGRVSTTRRTDCPRWSPVSAQMTPNTRRPWEWLRVPHLCPPFPRSACWCGWPNYFFSDAARRSARALAWS